jgi:hypothetical protein
VIGARSVIFEPHLDAAVLALGGIAVVAHGRGHVGLAADALGGHADAGLSEPQIPGPAAVGVGEVDDRRRLIRPKRLTPPSPDLD